MEIKRKRGRPSFKAKEEIANKRITFLLTEIQLEMLNKEVEKRNLTKTEFILELFKKEIKDF